MSFQNINHFTSTIYYLMNKYKMHSLIRSSYTQFITILGCLKDEKCTKSLSINIFQRRVEVFWGGESPKRCEQPSRDYSIVSLQKEQHI